MTVAKQYLRIQTNLNLVELLMANIGPTSPHKLKLETLTANLPTIALKVREVISKGAQSIVLSNGHNTVLLVTRYKASKPIELLREKLAVRPRQDLIEVPKLVATNVDVISLIAAQARPSKNTIRSIREMLSLQSRELLTQNVVYELPKHEGNLERLSAIRFKEDSINALEKTLTDTVELLHSVGITHNDIVAKNVLYSGTYPNLVFKLCDWGSCTLSDPIKDAHKYQTDFQKIKRIVNKAKEILQNKQKIRADLEDHLSSNYDRKMKKIGISPQKKTQSAQDVNREKSARTMLFKKFMVVTSHHKQAKLNDDVDLLPPQKDGLHKKAKKGI